MFNKYIWNLYKDSADGQIALKKDLSEHVMPSLRGKEAFHCSLHCVEYEGENVKEGGEHSMEVIDLRDYIRECIQDESIRNLDQAKRVFTKIADEGIIFDLEDEDGKDFGVLYGGGLEDASAYGEIIDSIEPLTAGLHDAHPEFFVPYFFARRFDVLEKVLKQFSLTIPEVPGKLKKRERALFYLGINEILQEFRSHHGLTPGELNAFLYDFAFKNIDFSKSDTLPAPSRVWFIIGGGKNGDAEFMEAADSKTECHWSGNLETRRGDIILMWCTAPKSCLHSIWRATDSGFNDPYFYYFSTVRVGHQVKIPPIPFSEIKNHPLLSQKSTVKGHFQGASGSTFSIEEYNAVLEILAKKKFDVKKLPLAPRSSALKGVDISNERDVEVKLLEPLLLRLGFSSKDWIRQMPIRMGRGERNYPDYVFGAGTNHGEESAVALIECKFSINKSSELKDAFLQAKSYALRLQSNRFTLADKRGLWIFLQREEGFSVDHFSFNTWEELQHPDLLHELSLLIGKRVIDALHEKHKRLKIG